MAARKGYRHPSTGDWLLLMVRWAFLITILVATTITPTPALHPLLLRAAVGLGTAFNVVALLALGFNLCPAICSTAGILIDTLVILFAFAAFPGGYNPLFVLAAVPVVAGTLRFGPLAGGALALLACAGYGASVLRPFTQGPPPDTLFFGVGAFALFLLVAVSAVGSARTASPVNQLDQRTTSDASRLQTVHDYLSLVYQLAGTLSATSRHEQVLDTLLEVSVKGLIALTGPSHQSVGMVLLYNADNRLQVSATRGIQDQDRHRTMAGQTGLVYQAIRSAEPATGGAAAADPELKAFDSLAGAQSILCVPLRAGYEVYGVVVLASPEPDAYSKEHAELITAFCNHAVVALRNTQLYQNLEEEKQRIIDSQEEARRRLARELHDGPTQSVSAIAMRLNFLKALLPRAPEKARVEVEKLETLARRTTKEIRTMLFTLRPIVLETQGLTAALQQYAEKIQDAEGLKVHVNSNLEERLPAAIEGVAFSVIEEAVNNARKHARANNIHIQLRLQDNMLVTEVQDDGRGFDLAGVDQSYDKRGSLGLVNMRERAALVSGTLSIDSKPGQGTLVTMVIPLRDPQGASPRP